MEFTTFTYVIFLKASKLFRKIFLWILRFYHFWGNAKEIRKNKTDKISIKISCHIYSAHCRFSSSYITSLLFYAYSENYQKRD